MQKTYSTSQISRLIEQYQACKGFELKTIEEGILGYGKIVLFADGKKTSVITEVAINSQYSEHKVRMYNSCPKKYQ